MNKTKFLNSLKEAAPSLWSQVNNLVKDWAAPVLSKLTHGKNGSWFPKTITDPVWGTIELLPHETLLLDSPLLQRLRGVRQLGMAHLVYPGAGHDRLEHSRGVVEAADRMIRALERNAQHRREYRSEQEVPMPSELDRISIRLAALLHDIGHGPFSHATEILLERRFTHEFDSLKEVLLEYFEGSTLISTSEAIAVIMVLSDSLKDVFQHSSFGACKKSDDLPYAISARIVGSRKFLHAGYLSGVISGPLDADKLDYMARDSHHSGLPLGLDLNRLLSKLEVVAITKDNALNDELMARAERDGPYYDMGIALPGLGAYEQMIIARVMLYDRIYYHHKVKAAEEMVRRLYSLAEEESQSSFDVESFYLPESDDSVIGILSGNVSCKHLTSGNERAKSLGNAIKARDLYYRAFAFASRYIEGISSYPENEQNDIRAELWGETVRALDDYKQANEFTNKIYTRTIALCSAIPDANCNPKDFHPEHVLIDIAKAKAIVRGGDILTRTEDGKLSTPHLFFDPERWSEAYEHQKRCGYIFAPQQFLPLVSLASKIVFYEKFQLVMAQSVDKLPKNELKNWITLAVKNGLCGLECAEVLKQEKPVFRKFKATDFPFPSDWKNLDPNIPEAFCEKINETIPAGLPVGKLLIVKKHFEHVLSFIEVMEKGGFSTLKECTEKILQNKLKDHLRSRKVNVTEGAELAGGETDLILSNSLVLENKLIKVPTDSPFKEKFYWQTRRYAIGLMERVSFGMIAYKPKTEMGYLPLDKRVNVITPENANEGYVQIWFAVPWGCETPSLAKPPTTKKKK